MTTSGRQSSESTSTVRDQAHNMAGKVVEKVQETASRMTGSDQRSGTAPGSGSGDRGAPVMEQASEQVTSRLDMGKDYVAETVTGLAQALRQTGQHLREDGSQPMLAQYADRSAEQIEHFGGYLRRHDTTQLVSDVEGFARRQPMAFAGGAFALGMLAVRFLRSKSQPQGYSLPSAGSGTSLSRQMPSTRPMMGQAGPGTMPRSPSMPPGGYTAGQAAPSGTPTRQPTTPSSSGPTTNTGLNPGTPAAPGPGIASPGTQADRPTPRPTAPPPGSGTSASSGTATPSPGTGARTGSSTPASERTGSGPRSQP